MQGDVRRTDDNKWRWMAMVALVAGCVEAPEPRDGFGEVADTDGHDDAEQEPAPTLPALSSATVKARCDTIKATAAARGITNPLIIAGIANHETHLVQCLSEWPIHCAGPHSDDCGGPVLAGSGDGPCGHQQGGLGMFQFDAGTYPQTLAQYGNGILGVAGNVDGGIDVILHKLRVCQHTSALVGSDQAAIDFINRARPGTDEYETYMSTMASCYNGCQPHYTSCSHQGMRAKYKAGVQALRDRLGDEYWYAPPTPDHGAVASRRVGASATGRLEVFALGDDASVLHRWQPQANFPFEPWASLGGPLAGAPTVATNHDGRLETFAVGGDGALYHRWQTTPGQWAGDWESMGAPGAAFVGEPFVARNDDGRLEVFVRSDDGRLWNKWQLAADSEFVGDWNAFGDDATSDVFVALNHDDRLVAFVRGADGSLVHRWQLQPSGGWSSWHGLGGHLAGPPTVGTNADGRLEVFVVADDGSLQHRWQEGDGWSTDWATHEGGTFVGTPMVASNLDGRMELVARGDDGRLWHTWQNEPNEAFEPGWAAFGEHAAGDPQFGRNADGRLEVFVRRSDGELWHTWQVEANATWAAWESLGGAIAAF